MGSYQECIEQFSGLIDKHEDSNRKNVFFFLSIAYKRCGETEAALRTLNLAIEKMPKHYDALLFRGKLLMKQRKYVEAA
jgi:tetratricopeptide (TPR) repeat protein